MASATWSRQKNLPKGFKLYCSKDWLQFYSQMGKPKKSYFSNEQLTPDALAARWLPEAELDRLIDGDDIDDAGRYTTVTSRLDRLSQITMTRMFRVQSRGHGAPVFPPNNGPTIEWLARAMEIWAALPEHDSEIFNRPAIIEKPRLGHMAETLAPLLQWARMSRPIVLATTNWMQADNDSYSDGEEPAPKPASNRERRIRPGSSYEELRSYIAKAGPLTVRKFGARLDVGGSWELVPADPAYPSRAGKLHIANGETEAAGERVEAGTILYQPDAFRELLGPEPDPVEKARNLSYWTSLFGAGGKELEPVRFRKRGKMRRKVLITPEEQKALLAGPLPSIAYCKPGLPCGHEDIGAQFVGGWISQTKGKAGVERWEDVSDELSRQAEFERWAKALPPEQAKAMNLACTAANFQEIGQAFGKAGKNAERYGKRMLIAANNNSKKILAA